MNVRAAPFYCPYCAEEALEPLDDAGSYYCNSCDRRFVLKFLGLGEDPA
ncbi:MAG: Insertion element protein [Actinomycetota bacterium]|nr:Insertion element protein [Actinomycetota bacterium]